MHIYMAAVYTNSYKPGQNRYVKLNEHEQRLVREIPHILESWHYVGKQKFVDDMRRDNAHVFLDSGAFSAHTLGVELKVEDYCDYICRNWDIIRVEDGNMMASVLDGIGDVEKTKRNQEAMEAIFKARGWKGKAARPLPCFHVGEPEQFLEEYVQRYDYITLGGMVGSSTKQLMTWLERMWDRYLAPGGHVRCKVHGFGITAVPIMEAFPWYSCDSSSWIQSAAFGSVILPGFVESNMAYPINVSEKSPSKHDWGQHISTLTQIEQDHVFSFLEQKGFTYERLSTIYESRAAFNLWSFGVVNALIDAQQKKARPRPQELF